MTTTPTDPLFASQWHLRNTTVGQFDLNVVDVWDDYTGNGIQVAVIDDSFDFAHADLNANFLAGLSYDYADGDFDPNPVAASDNHGTAVMGIIGAAANNGVGGVGVAYDVDLVGYRGFQPATLTEALLDAAGLGDGIGNTAGSGNGSDIVSMSFGFAGAFILDPNYLGAAATAGIVAADGRDGLGTILVKANGNSRNTFLLPMEGTIETLDTTAFTISVAAVRQDGWVTSYSTPGANLLVSAFADDVNNSGSILTTDRTGAPGYSSDDYVAGFNGTSAATPEVSGVVALVLEANPDLGWRDVQKILAVTARHVGSDVGTLANTGAPTNAVHEIATQDDGSTWFWNAADTWNGGAMHFSNDYGYGLIDAKAAVRLAETWDLQSTSANRVETSEDDVDPQAPYDFATRTFAITEPDDILIEHVALEVDFAHSFLSNLDFYLTSPEGTKIQLVADKGFLTSIDQVWSFGSTAFMGETSAGEWTFTARDDGIFFPLTINDVVLRTFGSAISEDDLFIVTNEYADYASGAAHGTVFDGGALGSDTFNAAALDADTVIDLGLGTGLVDGVAVSVSGIEAVYTGDGDDAVIGDSGAGILSTGRGNDFVRVGREIGAVVGSEYDGGAGIDRIDWSGNAGVNNSFNLSTGVVTQASSSIVDVMTGFEHLRGTASVDMITGSDDANILEGKAGDDTIDAGAGDDVLLGGAGADSLSGGTGTDRAQYTDAAAGVKADLQLSIYNTGIAAGDNYDSIEDLRGSNAIDDLRGDGGANRIEGLDGADILNGRAGDDFIVGGNGDDRLLGGLGADMLFGGAGLDRALYADALSGVTADLQNSALNTGDRAIGDSYSQIEGLQGSALNDGLRGNGFANLLIGADGNDFLIGRNGDDVLLGGNGDDVLTGGNGADVLNGGRGIDQASYIEAISGVTADLQNAAANTGIAAGDTYIGIENLRGARQTDILSGNGQANRIEGFGGDDLIKGCDGDDELRGGQGDDILIGGAGDDLLVGSTGNDTYQFNAPSDGVDTIQDMISGVDTIMLDNAGFGALMPGALAPNTFHVGTAAADADDFIIYDSATGNLYYDEDGAGGVAQIQFATIGNTPILNATDFSVI